MQNAYTAAAVIYLIFLAPMFAAYLKLLSLGNFNIFRAGNLLFSSSFEFLLFVSAFLLFFYGPWHCGGVVIFIFWFFMPFARGWFYVKWFKEDNKKTVMRGIAAPGIIFNSIAAAAVISFWFISVRGI